MSSRLAAKLLSITSMSSNLAGLVVDYVGALIFAAYIINSSRMLKNLHVILG